jgi:hypothetical protein
VRGVASPSERSLGGRGEGWVAAQVALVGVIVLCETLGPSWPESAAHVLAAAGVVVAVAGWSMAATPVGLAATALGALFLELKTRREEAWLVARYPSYDAYRRRVPWKFVPGVR